MKLVKKGHAITRIKALIAATKPLRQRHEHKTHEENSHKCLLNQSPMIFFQDRLLGLISPHCVAGYNHSGLPVSNENFYIAASSSFVL
jgi:hypothetical protein